MGWDSWRPFQSCFVATDTAWLMSDQAKHASGTGRLPPHETTPLSSVTACVMYVYVSAILNCKDRQRCDLFSDSPVLQNANKASGVFEPSRRYIEKKSESEQVACYKFSVAPIEPTNQPPTDSRACC